ncbi:MAG: HNH endonuclease [Candidatus Marinimicrobia bacterium]|nr:HNH endonuclease [Candidatus Neomarinimicrobiota bacterium]
MCAQCGSKQKLEFDHIIPVSKGGADTYRNLQLLCENCNRSKSAKIG